MLYPLWFIGKCRWKKISSAASLICALDDRPTDGIVTPDHPEGPKRMTLMIRFCIAVCALAIGVPMAALAEEVTVLRGADAFGGWQDDAPGTVRHLTAVDIAAAGREARSASNAPGTADQPVGALPSVPEGFSIEKVISDLPGPRTLAFAPNGDLFVADSWSDQVLVFRFGADGQVGESGVFAADLNQPYGLAFAPQADPDWLYVGTTDGLVRLPYDGGMRPNGVAETLFDDIPTGGHWTRSIAFSADGATLYYAIGSQSNVGQGMGAPPGGLASWRQDAAKGASWGNEDGRALVLAMNPDGGNRRVFATGLRNCSGLAVQPRTDAVWCAVNERDALGNNIPFDYVTSVAEGGFYGWPWFYIGANPDPRHGGARDDLAGDVLVPDVLLQSHSAPLNLTFFTSDAWGDAYEGDAFVALHGSWNRNPRTGYKIVRLPMEDGVPTGAYEDFVTGFVIDDNSVWGRPVGVAVSPDGALYFSEDANGTIWRVTRQ